MSTDEKVRRHFDADAVRFDAIYEDRKDPFRRFIDNVWRGVVRRRLELSVQLLEPLAGKRVLDVGCGSGRFSIEFARRGAHAVGVDFAPEMIKIADEAAERLGVQDRTEFLVGGFPEAVPEGRFDASVAVGFFDYIEHPEPMVEAMRDRTRGQLLMSFPKSREFRVPLRRLKFKLLGVPLYLYSERRVREILASAGLKKFDWIDLGRDYFVVAHTDEPVAATAGATTA